MSAYQNPATFLKLDAQSSTAARGVGPEFVLFRMLDDASTTVSLVISTSKMNIQP
jgi:hypothetical protein